MENPGKITAHDLKLPTRETVRHTHNLFAGTVHDRSCACTSLHSLHLRENAHTFQYLHGCAAKVDSIASRPHRRRSFNERGPKAIAAQPEGKCRAGDARPRDKDVSIFHARLQISSA